jgi:hypothetical protein
MELTSRAKENDCCFDGFKLQTATAMSLRMSQNKLQALRELSLMRNNTGVHNRVMWAYIIWEIELKILRCEKWGIY